MLKVVLFFLGVSIVAIEAARTACTQKSQCGADECCYYHEGPLIMSRKRQLSVDHQSISTMHQGGYCEAYKRENQPCSVFAQMNGHCGCGSGLHCKFVPLPTPDAHLLLSRSMVYQGPGSYQCVRS